MIPHDIPGWEPRELSLKETPYDPQMPQLAIALCPQQMKQRLAIEIPQVMAGLLELRDVQIVFTRYKPGRYCHVFYQCTLIDQENGKACTALAGTKFFSNPISAGYVRRRTSLMTSDGPMPAWLHLSELNAVVLFFPNDLKLQGLRSLFHDDDLQLAVDSAGIDLQLATSQNESSTKQILSYRPERYCLVRLTTTEDAVFGRMFHTLDETERVHAIMESLWQSRNQNGLILAKPLGYDAESRIGFQSSVPGKPLTGQLNQESTTAYMEAAAELLANIHACSVPAELFDVESELQSYRVVAAALRRISPDGFANVDQLIDRLANCRPTRQDAIGFTHGDFSSNQLLADGERLGVIDFGSCRIADAHRDVANFVVRLENHLTGELLNRAQQLFVQAYQQRRPNIFDERSLAWHQARAALNEGLVAFRKLRPGWIQRTSRCFGRAQEQLDTTQRGVLL